MIIRVSSIFKYFIVALCLSLGACSNPYATQDTGVEIKGQPIESKLEQDRFKDQVSKESINIKIQLTDALITTRIKAALRADVTLAATDIQVNTVAGIVTLTGHVESLAISEKASEISRAISEVKEVSNSLIIAT
jgi:osmotically-inducible protein OsmY